MHLPLGPLEAEAKALDVAVSFAWDIGVRDVIFETNSNMVFTIISGSTTPPDTIVDVMEGIQLKLQDFRRSQVQHMRQQGNKLAHALAQHAKGIHSFVTWIEECPHFIESLVFHYAIYLSSS